MEDDGDRALDGLALGDVDAGLDAVNRAIDAYMRNSTDSQKSQILHQLQEENIDRISTTREPQQGNSFVHKYGSLLKFSLGIIYKMLLKSIFTKNILMPI